MCRRGGVRPAGAPTGSPRLATSPETAGGGWVWGRFAVRRSGSNCVRRRPPPPPTPANSAGEGDAIHSLRSAIEFSPLREERTGRGRGRGTPADAARSNSPSLDLRRTPNLPQQFWGRWASNASPEGAPADAARTLRSAIEFSPLREERTGRGRGRGTPRTQPEAIRRVPISAELPTSPSSFGGGGRVMRARRGRPRPAPCASKRSTSAPRRPRLAPDRGRD